MSPVALVCFISGQCHCYPVPSASREKFFAFSISYCCCWPGQERFLQLFGVSIIFLIIYFSAPPRLFPGSFPLCLSVIHHLVYYFYTRVHACCCEDTHMCMLLWRSKVNPSVVPQKTPTLFNRDKVLIGSWSLLITQVGLTREPQWPTCLPSQCWDHQCSLHA